MRVGKICASEGKHVFRQVESSSYLKIQDPGEKHLTDNPKQSSCRQGRESCSIVGNCMCAPLYIQHI